MSFLDGSDIEIIHTNISTGNIRHALFDFDGTVSLIREGWQGVMIPMMVEILMETPQHESKEALEALVRNYVGRLTGKQTIYQMIQLCEEIRLRGGEPLPALDYKWQYLERLNHHIKSRIQGLQSGVLSPQEMMVPGALAMLQNLSARGVTCYLASGTDEMYVLQEAASLGITAYFAGIYGAQDDYVNYSKKMVIDRILKENELHGHELVAFGDGYVEIEDAAAAGGITVGVATNEAQRQGIDAWKRQRLIDAGADIIIPDFCPHQRLIAFLFAEE